MNQMSKIEVLAKVRLHFESNFDFISLRTVSYLDHGKVQRNIKVPYYFLLALLKS